MPVPSPRTVFPTPSPPTDRCPGALRPHAAADGALVRLRLPGGRISGPALARLGALSAEFGDGSLHLTSRGNLQVRGLADPVPDAFSAGLSAAGLLPSPTHERVRNIVASPLSGIAGGRADIRTLIPRLDEGLRADPALAGLSGRFLFGLDDGRGDIAALRPDVWARCLDGATARIGVGGFAGPAVPLVEAPSALLELARRFLAAAGGAWNARGLPDGGRGLLDGGLADGGLADGGLADEAPAPEPMRYGLLGTAASVLVPLGVLGPQQISAISGRSVVVTPWRGLVVEGVGDPAALDALVAAGLTADPDSPWARITACVGAPGCAKSAGDTHARARELAAAQTLTAQAPVPIHVIGCERACGAPTFHHNRVLVRSVQ